ncbi:TPA: hypothetical protein ACH3X2_010833 [Trebouxia sp. C0005]
MSYPEPQAHSQSSGSDFWSASDHSSLTESFHSWPSSEAGSPAGLIEVDLIASETLSTSDGDSVASTATPTFSDLPDASQGEPRLDGEEIAKQLDFGPGPSNAEGYSSSSKPVFVGDVDSVAISTEACSFTAARNSSSSSSDDDLQYTAASAKPTFRRRAALESDSDAEQAETEQSLPVRSLALQTQSAYDLLIATSSQSGDSDSPEAQAITSSSRTAQPLQSIGTGDQRQSGNVIVLVSSDDDSDNGMFCGGADIRQAVAEGTGAAHKENVSPDQLASRLHTLQIAPNTAAKPSRQPRQVLLPRQPQSLPPKPSQRSLVSAPLTVTQAKSSAAFRRQREALAYELFRELNTAVFSSRLPADLQISWNAHLKTTAGLTHYSRVTLAGEPPKYTARVELSTKVLDNAEKLHRTLCHELCHVATWLLDHVAKPPHGAHFKAWAAAAMTVHPHLDITTCHQYDIHFAWRWQCINPKCQQMYKRHSNSIDTSKQVCSACRGQLQALGRFNADGTHAKVRAPSQYSLFVKNNFATQKQKCGPGTPHKEIMQALSASWKARAASGAADDASALVKKLSFAESNL